jgi:two-component system, NtrC family, sensor histidine kinase HydH
MTSSSEASEATRLERLSDKDIEVLTWKEIGIMARFIARARTFIFPVLFILGLLLVLMEPDPWRVWLFVGAGLGVSAIVLRDYFWLKNRALVPSDILYVLGVVVAFQAVLIAVTGGVESPFFVIFVPMGILPSLVIGRRRPWLLFALLPISVVWLFTLGGVTGFLPRLTPDYWGSGARFGPNGIYAMTRATIYTIAILLGGTIGLALRQALERSVRGVIETRQELVRTMRDRNRELLSLSGELAHELKNPLASIQGLSALMLKKLPADTKEAEQMGVLIGEVKRMGATLDEFLNFSRPVSGLAVREVHPAALLADVCLIHEGIAHHQNVTLKVDPGDATPILCDPRKVTQVLVNLLQNALEATPPGGRVSLTTAHLEDGAARIIIEDSGAGLSSEVEARLFTPGATTKPEGTGLGLTIARAIAEQHGGTLTLVNRDRGGCRAELTLPRSPTDPPPTEPGEPT